MGGVKKTREKEEKWVGIISFFCSWLRGYVGKECGMLFFRERKLERVWDGIVDVISLICFWCQIWVLWVIVVFDRKKTREKEEKWVGMISFFCSWLKGYVGKDCGMLFFRERKLERVWDDLCLRWWIMMVWEVS